ncbi:Inosine-5'-monophosphate dehydrogenase 1, partial [Tetrabaena socialis]
GTSAEAAAAILRKSKKNKLPIVNAAGELVALATRAYFKDSRSLPAPGEPTVDAAGRLRCGAAVGTREADKDRVKLLYEQGGVDAIILDSSQGDSTYQVGA